MDRILITGANRGIGLELVKQSLKKGWFVHACYRTEDNAHQLFKIADEAADKIKLHAVDVTNNAAISQLSRTLNTEPIDILINNAGVFGPKNTAFGNVPPEMWVEVFKTNTIAPLMMAQALADNIAKSKRKLIINISSNMSSITDNNSGGEYIYRSSKAALNAVTKSMAIDLKPKGITVIALHPGWVQTDMGGPAALITATDSVRGILAMLDAINVNDSGHFLTHEGERLSW